MADVVGRGTIELVGDARKLKATIEDAKKSVRTLGEGQKDISKSAQRSIDNYIGRLQAQSATLGKTTRQTELYKLALRGASNEQLKTADTALRAAEAHARNAQSIQALKSGFIGLFAVAVTGAIAAAVAFDRIVKQTANFQDAAEKIGDTAEAVASLAVAAAGGGASMEEISAFSIKLTKNLTGVDDESEAAGAAIKALGLDLKTLKDLKAADQLEAIAKALAEFGEGRGKTSVLEALAKGGAQLLPFLKELGKEGSRQVILTSEQIRLADEYADQQAVLKAQIGLHAQAIVTQMLPAYNDLQGAFLDLIKGIAGMKTGVKGLGNSTDIQDFAESAVKSIAFVIDAFDGVARLFEVTGKRLGALAAGAASILRGELRAAAALFNESQEDTERILARPLVSQLLEARIAARKTAEANPQFRDKFDVDTQGRPKLKFEGAAKKDTAASQEAKARLALDLDQIKTASEATTGAFANAERIMQAMRAANLVNDRDYYASKLGFITLNSREQEAALQKEIERLQKENLIGKDRIDNERKIAEAQAKLVKVRADTVASIEINSIQEAAANQKIAQSYVDAKIAADAYIASIVRRNQAEIEGIGRGTKFREVQSGRNVIEDKFLGERQTLERDLRNQKISQATFDAYLAVARETYAKEIELYDQRTAAIQQKEAEWTNGASEAMANYIEQTRDIAKQTEELFTNAFRGAGDALVDFIRTGKLDFKSLADSIIADLIRIQVRKTMASVIETASGAGGLIGAIGGLFKAASGLQFTVGGAGGTDSQFIPIMATPGERVTVETPAQQRSGGMNVSNVFHIAGPVDRRTQAQVAAAAGEGLQRAMARNN